MVAHCTDCCSWDEDQADKEGRAPCRRLFRAIVDSGEGLVSYTTDGDSLMSLSVRGDFGCALFIPKRSLPIAP